MEKIGPRPGRFYVEVDPNIENAREFPGFANRQLDPCAAAGPLVVRWPDLGVLELQDSSGARLQIGDRITQRTREGNPVGNLTAQRCAHEPNIGKTDAPGTPAIPIAVRMVAAIIAGVTGLSRGSAPIRSELP